MKIFDALGEVKEGGELMDRRGQIWTYVGDSGDATFPILAVREGEPFEEADAYTHLHFLAVRREGDQS